MNGPVLQFTEGGTFQLTVFSDLHFAEDDEADANSRRVMEDVLAQEDSQMVVLNGDLISGEATNRSMSSAYIDRVVAPLVGRRLPWASTYGNHDSELNLDPQQTFLRENRYPNSLTSKMVSGHDAGVTNYYLPVFYHGASSDSIPAVILWFFDSRGGHVPLKHSGTIDPIPRPNWVDDSTVEWFTRTNANLTSQYGRSLPSLVFFHIPVNAMRAFQKTGVNPATEPGINGERVIQQGYGGGFDYNRQDFRFMQALLNTADLMGTFSGHDHDNDWCFKWTDLLPGMDLAGNGINMCYTRHTGYGGYGDWPRGGRQILLDQQKLDSLRTWVRLEDGTISGDVHLNASYGHDRYLPVDNQSTVILPQYSFFVLVWALFFSIKEMSKL